MPQGTVKSFDHATRSGVLVTDALEELPYDAATFDASQLLELRIGQRVRFDVEGTDDDARIRNLQLVSL